jgi:hypothetical protein
VHSMTPIKGAILFDLNPGRMLFFVLGSGVIFILALGAL